MQKRQLDKLARYLINYYGDIIKVDDIPDEDVVDEAIRILELQRNLTQKKADELDKEIKDATKALRECEEDPEKDPFYRETAKRIYLLKGLLRAQKI